ncbi:hypothetical protein ACN0IV_05995 [Trabulsiella odontotermitis]|uniref:hypothetical protein n=1 Tax=Trabulsiella odontotermitis TaxID=379893 RepID=UPI003ACAEFD8
MKKILFAMTTLALNTSALASTFTCYDPNDYQQMEMVNGDTGTALYFKVGDVTLYRHGTGVKGESIYVNGDGSHELQVKFINSNLTFIKLYHKKQLKVIVSCKEH